MLPIKKEFRTHTCRSHKSAELGPTFRKSFLADLMTHREEGVVVFGDSLIALLREIS